MGDVLTGLEHETYTEKLLREGATDGGVFARSKLYAHDAALRARCAELEAEVDKWQTSYGSKSDDLERCNRVLWSKDEQFVKASDRIAELEVEVERLRQDWRIRAESETDALARAEAEERECKQIKSWADATIAASDSACEQWKAQSEAAEAELAMLMGSTDGVRQAVVREQERARAAEAREAGLREALATIAGLRGGNTCEEYCREIARAALAAAPAKEVPPCR